MHLDIVWNDESIAVDLIDGSVSVGGGPKDDIFFSGLPVKLLTLEVNGTLLAIKSTRALRVGHQLFPAKVPRLLMPGEVLRLPNDVVVRRPEDNASRERRRNKGTDFLAKELLSNDLAFLETRAATLACVAGPDKGHVYPLAFLDTSLGRGDDVDVRLHDRTVSRRHARLLHKKLSYFVEDLATTNGIYVNGLRVKDTQRLDTGDILELGHSVLRFDSGERAPGERTVIERPPSQPPVVPAPSTPSPIETTAITTTAGRLQRTPTDLAIVIIGALLVVSGLTTAALFFR
jgi:hypothetical protein